MFRNYNKHNRVNCSTLPVRRPVRRKEVKMVIKNTDGLYRGKDNNIYAILSLPLFLENDKEMVVFYKMKWSNKFNCHMGYGQHYAVYKDDFEQQFERLPKGYLVPEHLKNEEEK